NTAGEASVMELADEGLSVSAIHGKAFTAGGRTYGHVIDPRTGAPVSRALAAPVAGPSASTCEVLSTAVLGSGPARVAQMCESFIGYRGGVAYREGEGEVKVARHGL